MYYELRRYRGDEYDLIINGSLRNIALFLFENGFESYLDFEGTKLFAISESEVNKSLLAVEVARIESEIIYV